jgi:hypothetical protein
MTDQRSLEERIASAIENTPPWATEAIRSDERHRISSLLTESAETIGRFATDGKDAVSIVALMLNVDGAQ